MHARANTHLLSSQFRRFAKSSLYMIVIAMKVSNVFVVLIVVVVVVVIVVVHVRIPVLMTL